MAQVTFEVDNEDVPRIVHAFEIRYGVKPPEEGDAAFVKRHMIQQVNLFVKDANATEAKRESLANHVDLDIT
jgi:hypothetical protein